MTDQEYNAAMRSVIDRFTEWNSVKGWTFVGFPEDEESPRALCTTMPDDHNLPPDAKQKLCFMLKNGVESFPTKERMSMILVPNSVCDTFALQDMATPPIQYEEDGSYVDAYDWHEDHYEEAGFGCFNPEEYQDAHPVLSSVYKQAVPRLQEWFAGFVLVLFVSDYEDAEYPDCEEVVIVVDRLSFRFAAYALSRWVLEFDGQKFSKNSQDEDENDEKDS